MVEQLEHAEAEAAVNELQQKLDRLRVLYEQYFLGISKREPLVPLKDVVRLVHKLDQQQIRNTGLRFRLRNLIQKFNVYRTYWKRTLRAIEAGTYKRDVARVRRKYAREGVEMPDLGKMRTTADVERAMADAAAKIAESKKQQTKRPNDVRGVPAAALRDQVRDTVRDNRSPFVSGNEAEAALDAALGAASTTPDAPAVSDTDRDLPAVARTAPSAPARRPRPRPAPGAAADGISEDNLRSIYRRMVKAKRMVGDNPDSVSYDGLARTLSRQLPKLREMHPGKQIDFQVVIRQGKVVLKASPK